MGSNYMIIGPKTSIEPAADGGFMVLVDGQQWCPDDSRCEHVWETAEQAWAAYRKDVGFGADLDDMARDMVGDGKSPNLYFVTVDEHTHLATADQTVARHYAQNPELMGVFSPAAQEYPIQIEDRHTGLVWENGASIAQQDTEEEGDDRCPHTHGGRHVLDDMVQKADCDASDSKSIVVDVSCRACGRSGSVTISPDDVQW